MAAIAYIDGQTGERCEEVVLGGGLLGWYFQRSRPAWLDRLLFERPWLSRLLGAYYGSRWSRRHIRPAIEQLGIDPSEFAEPVERFTSFNAFFVRRLKPACRPFDPSTDTLVAPADGRYLAWQSLAAGRAIPLKGQETTLAELLGDERTADPFAGGPVVVIRLCPADYHRFHFPCDGELARRYDLGTAYYSVNPLALAREPRVFARNHRCVSLLQTPFGRVAMVEVGAFGVGSIVQTGQQERVAKMAEKGYFQFGGSSIVLAAKPGGFRLSEELLMHTAEGLETLLRVGEPLGRAEAGICSGNA